MRKSRSMNDVIRVGMADYKLCHSPQKISTIGLGSCLGVVIYDPSTEICGLAHVMLPSSKKISNNSNRMKFVDTCLQDMYDALLQALVDPKKLMAKVAGGAKMFCYNSTNEFLNVGAQNYVATVKKLAELRIPVMAEDVGETYSRTIEFDPVTGMLTIKAAGMDEYVI